MQISKLFMIAGFCLVSILLGVMACKAADGKGFKNVGAEEFSKLCTNKTNVVLDVRRNTEFTSGHITNAVLIDFSSADFEKKVTALDKTKTYLVYCAVGARSSRACDKMSTLGFTNLYNLEGGISAWKKAGKPVTEEEK
jgi:rhodanese-related sulfurtransferase